jgi:hypothetical protein
MDIMRRLLPVGAFAFAPFAGVAAGLHWKLVVSVRVAGEPSKDLLRLAAEGRAGQKVPAEALLGEADRGAGLVRDAAAEQIAEVGFDGVGFGEGHCLVHKLGNKVRLNPNKHLRRVSNASN